MVQEEIAAQEITPARLTWRSRRLRFKVLRTALLLAFFCYAFFTWVLWPVTVVGDSMMPNYQNDSRHWINKLSYWSGHPQRGDVVGLYAPNGDVYLKRVIGLPGEKVSFEEGAVLINNQPLEEKYVQGRMPWELETLSLGQDDYFVMGDNRPTSWLGLVPGRRLIGKVVY